MIEPRILDQLHSTDPEVRRETLDELISRAAVPDPDLRDPISIRLRELMLSDSISDPERQSAAEALGAIGSETELMSLIGHSSAVTRGHVASGLGRCGTESSIRSLIGLLQDDVNTVRNLAERALIGRLGDVKTSGVEQLLGLLSHPEPLTHSPAARLLGLTQDDRALQPLLALLKSGDKWLSRVWAAKALGDLGNTSAVVALIDTLRHEEKNRVRAAAAAALGELHDPAGLEPLKAALGDEDEGVQAAARDALDLLNKSGAGQPEDPFATE